MGVFSVPDHLANNRANGSTFFFNRHLIHIFPEHCQNLSEQIEFSVAQMIGRDQPLQLPNLAINHPVGFCQFFNSPQHTGPSDGVSDQPQRVQQTCYNFFVLRKFLSQLRKLRVVLLSVSSIELNWKKGKRTHVFIDEFHVVFENEFSAAFFNSAWRQFRKRNAFPTAITQNVEYLLDSVQASTMLSNSEFIVMLNQAASDREKLGRLLNISNEQMNYITNVEAGSGLIKYGSALVPFINRFPKNTKLYQLMTTRPGEGRFAGQS